MLLSALMRQEGDFFQDSPTGAQRGSYMRNTTGWTANTQTKPMSSAYPEDKISAVCPSLTSLFCPNSVSPSCQSIISQLDQEGEATVVTTLNASEGCGEKN